MDRAPSPDRIGGPLRVLWVIDSLTAGGAESLVVSFARSIDPERVDLRVVCLKTIGGNPFEAALRDAGVACENLGARHLRDAAALRRLVARVRELRPHVLHAHLTYASIWGPLAARLAGVPSLATLHLPPPDAPPWSREGTRERLRRRTVDRWCAAAVAVSRYVADAHLETGRIDPDRLVVVHNGVDTRAFRPATGPADPRRRAAREELGVPDDAPLVMAVSVLRPGKGIGTLVEAATGVPGARFAIVGDGPLGPAIVDRIHALGLDGRVTMTGFRPDVADLLPAADLLVLPSEVEDALPTVLMEAAATGLPVVATRVGGVAEIVDDDRTGVLVEPGSPRRLGETIEELLADPDRRSAMGRRGRRAAERSFSLPVWRDRLVSVYAAVLEDER